MKLARLALLGLTLASGCARTEAPVGGPVPETAMEVVATVPANLSLVEPFEGPVEILFGRPLSERTLGGLPQDAVLLSPATGLVEVDIGDESIEVSLEGGFQAGQVYRLTLLPVVQDRFNNRMSRAYDLFFSTGPALEPNLVAGIVQDRLTLGPADEIRVDAVSGDGTVVQSAATDSTGVFSLPYLTAGAYTLVAYEDVARDGSAGFLDPQDSLAVTVNPGDTLIVTDLAVLEPDSTAAVLQDVVSIDPMTLRATFDDYLDPNVPLIGLSGFVRGGGQAIPVGEYLHEYAYQIRNAAAAAATPGAIQPPAPTGPPLPSRDMILTLTSQTVSGVTYEVDVQNVVNINGVPGGGGIVEMTPTAVPAPPAGGVPDAQQPGADPNAPPVDPNAPPVDPNAPPAAPAPDPNVPGGGP